MHRIIIKNRWILVLLLCLTATLAEAQVGINTITPYTGSSLHIRSDKSASGDYENDLIISNSTGYVGLGTATPIATLDINGKLRYQDGSSTDLKNHVLASDSDGNLGWKDVNKALRFKNINWSLSDDNYPDITVSNNIFTAGETTDFTSTIDNASVTNNTLILPKGRYMITVSAGIYNSPTQYIYQIIKLLNRDEVLLESYYFNTATGLSAFLDADTEQEIRVQIESVDVSTDPNKSLLFANAFPIVGPNKIWATVNVLKIDICE